MARAKKIGRSVSDILNSEYSAILEYQLLKNQFYHEIYKAFYKHKNRKIFPQKAGKQK
jgi:hypothetical protein